MTKLYFVIAPNGNLAYVGPDAARAEFYRPAEAPSFDGGYHPISVTYELYSVDADTPWINEREERNQERDAVKAALTDAIQKRFER